METVRVRKAGYSIKLPVEQFFGRYSVLNIASPSDVQPFLSEYTTPDMWALGNTKIFLRQALV